MYRFELTAAVLLLIGGAVEAQPPQDMLAGRVAQLEQRVAALEAKLGVAAPPQATQLPINVPGYYLPGNTFGQSFVTQGSFSSFGEGGSVCGAGGCGPAQAGVGRVGLFGGRFRR